MVRKRSVASVAHDACALLPNEPGVYRFRDASGRVMYIGRATDLRSRTRSYWGDLANRRHLRRMVPQIATVEAAVCASVHEAAWFERNLLKKSMPRWNRARGGYEVPVWLVVDDDERSPDLHIVVKKPGAAELGFGPYLGIERVRLARRGLLRVLPLPHTGNRLSAFDRSFADVRNTGPEQRGRVVETMRGLLDREPQVVEHVVGLLSHLRDRTAALLAFETAQQIQDEIAAVTWLVSPQRVMGGSRALKVLTAASNGVHVSFHATNGRLDRWEVAHCVTRRDEFPDDISDVWRDFLERNVMLAVQLHYAQGSKNIADVAK